jgi:ribosomal protein S18 acetylase RimI-like enzyme
VPIEDGPRSATAGIPQLLSDWTIRAATHGDIEAVLALWRLAGTPATAGTHAEGLSTLFAADPGALILGEADGAVVGSLIAAWDGWRGSFYRLAVHPDRRRNGLGTALVRAGERRLLERNAARLTTIVADDDPRALAFWIAAGYERQAGRARLIRSAPRPDCP